MFRSKKADFWNKNNPSFQTWNEINFSPYFTTLFTHQLINKKPNLKI